MVSWVKTDTSIVVVEDPLVGRLVHSVLGRRGFHVQERSPETALDLLCAAPHPNVVITNQPQLFVHLANMIGMIYMAACPDDWVAASFPRCRVLHKPFHPRDLLDAVEALLE